MKKEKHMFENLFGKSPTLSEEERREQLARERKDDAIDKADLEAHIDFPGSPEDERMTRERNKIRKAEVAAEKRVAEVFEEENCR